MSKALFVLVFALAAVECSGQIGVAFSGMNFKMTCPINYEDDVVTWTKGTTLEKLEKQSSILELKYDETSKGQYKCVVSPKSHYFYVQGKVCDNCYELNGGLLVGLIFADLLLTGGVMILIYNCAQRKSTSAPSPAPASGRPGRGSAPSVPDRDYEQLNHATRDTGTYAVAGVHRTG